MARNPIQELAIGPFSGGINTYADPSRIGDNEAADAVNFDISLDGSLKSRPPWSLLTGKVETSTVGGGNPPESNQEILGTFVYGGARFLVFTSNHIDEEYASFIYYLEGPNAGVVAKMGDGLHSKAHRYVNDIYLVPHLENEEAGLKYDLGTGTTTVIEDMPVGYTSVVYKDRLWISGRRNNLGIPNNSRLFFSEVGDFEDWPDTNFFDINPGDGDAVHGLAVYQDNILIFKDNATYVLAYDTGPAQAVLQVINTDIGVMGPRCVVTYENSVFVLQYNQVYEMSNYDFEKISVKIPFEYDDTLPEGDHEFGGQTWRFSIWMSVVGDRLVVRYFNNLYVYHLRLKAWTRWTSEDVNIKYIGPIHRLDNTNTALNRGVDTYIAPSALTKVIDGNGPGSSGDWNIYLKFFVMEDKYESTITENGEVDAPSTPVDIKLTFLSKMFDIGLSHRFKRLMHWGIDTFTGRPVTGTLFPFTVAYKVTWEQLHIYKWSELQTWGYPLAELPGVEQTIPTGTGIHTRYVRFPKSLRFRLLQFKVQMVTKGNTTDGPVYLYSVTAFIAAKQLAPEAVN